MKQKVFVFLAAGVLYLFPFPAQAETWQQLKDKHFIVLYNFKEDTRAAETVLRRAEEYYSKIANQIGYSRYANFWTWDERVKIIIFPSQEAFMQTTGQPAWSRGYSNRDSRLFRSRTIITYRQESEFLEGVLPHEVGHLILKDFVGFNTTVPLWFEEGVAQLQESDKKLRADQSLRPVIKRGIHIPFNLLMAWDIRKETDSQKVSLFYLQSVSIVDFLLKRYGSGSFGNLCRGLKNGKGFEEALRAAYSSAFFKSIEELEKKWLSDMKQ